MLKIKIGNTWVDTQNIEIPVKLTSPLFLKNGRILGSRIYNFTLPLTEELKAEIGYLHRPGKYGKPIATREFYLEYGPLKFVGTSKIVEASSNNIEVSCPVNTGDLVQILKSLNMSDVDLGGVRTSPENMVQFNFALNTVINNGSLIFNLKVNGFITKTFVLNSELNLFSFELPLNPTDVISWNILASSQASFIPDEYSLDFSIDSGGTMEILGESTDYVFAALSEAITHSSVDTQEFELTFELPFDFITINLNGILNEAGLIIEWVDDSIMEAILSMYPDNDFAVFPIENDKFFDELQDDVYAIDHLSIKEIYSKYYPILNYFKNGGFPSIMTGSRNGETRSAYNLFCPFPYLAYFIKQMALKLQVQISNNVFEEDDLKQLVIYNAFAENNYLTDNLIKKIEGFDLNKHVPDIALSNFVNEVFKLLGIVVDYDSQHKKIRLANLKDIIADLTVTDFTGTVISDMSLKLELYNGYSLKQNLSSDTFATEMFKSLDGLNFKGTVTIWNMLPNTGNEINDCYFVSFWDAYYVWSYDPELGIINWVFYSNGFRHVVENIDSSAEGEVFDLNSNWAACMVNYNPKFDNQLIAPEGRHWIIPQVREPGNFEGMLAYKEIPFSNYLLFYRGMQKDNLDNDYPLGTNDVYDYAGTKIEGADLALRWDGEYGLYEKRLKNWIEWYINNAGPLKFKATFTPLALTKIDWFKWYQVNGIKFLIEEIEFVIKRDKLSIANVTVRRR
jgi:hypothetical protein